MTGWLPKIDRMRDVRAPAGSGGARYALAAVAVALFGLLSMHGWGSHTGAHSMGAMPQNANVTIVTSGLGAIVTRGQLPISRIPPHRS